MQASAGYARPDLKPLEQHRTLVLSAGHEPVGIVCWQRAILLFLSGKCDTLELHDRMIHSVSQSLPLPSVLRIRSFLRSRVHKRAPQFSRQHVFLRDNFQCQYCGEFFLAKELSLDHVVPLVQGGKTSWANVVTSCTDCNQRKGGKTPTQAGFKLLKQPRDPHLGFIPDLFLLRGRVPEVWTRYLSPSDLAFVLSYSQE